jgi:hypothetical protein
MLSLRALAAVALALALLAGEVGEARAQVRRYAFLVGANQGAAHEAPLRYAESDVKAVAETLVQLGGFDSERVVQLRAPSAERVRKALLDLVLTIQRDLRGGGEAMLFAYYSGHADAQNLHLGGTEMPSEELSSLVRLSQAKLKVLLLDACRSGALTRVKGGRPVAPFQIGVQDMLGNEGYALITSSSAGEDAQESEALRSSVFTHHFLGGLRGLADANGDRLVTLGEVYGYASEQTVKASIQTVAGTQHATYYYDHRGRADPVLSDLRRRGLLAELVLGTPGEYLLMDGASGALLFEAAVKSARTPLQIGAGRYRVRARTRDRVYELDVALDAGESRSLDIDQMRSVPLAQVVRKGETAERLASGPSLAGTVHGPLGAGFSPMMGLQLGWAFELPKLTVIPRLSIAQGNVDDPAGSVQSHTLREIAAELAALYVFDFGRLALAPMLSAGWGFYQQRLDLGAGCAAASCQAISRPQGLITTVGGWGGFALGRGFTVELSLELASFYLRRQAGTAGPEKGAPRAGTLTYRTGLGIGYRY